MKFCSNCGNKLRETEISCQKCGAQINGNTEYYRQLNKEQAKKNSPRNSKIAFVLALLALALTIYCWIASGGDSSEAGEGAVWWTMIFLGYPIILVSIGFGLQSFTADKNKLALISLIINCIPFFIQFVLL